MKNMDHLQRRCPRLGNTITFEYCRTSEPEFQPCDKIFNCWWEYFDVVEYLKEILDEEVFYRIATCRPKPKILSLVELVEQTQKKLSADKNDTT